MSLISTITNLASGGTTVLYRYAAIAGAILALCVGSFSFGLHQGGLKSKAAIATYADERDKALLAVQALQNDTNIKVVTKYITRTQVIHDHAEQIHNDIDHLTDTAVLSLGWLQSYNDSLGELPATPSGTSDPTPAIGAVTALSGIADNNATCLAYKARAEALMDYERQTQANIAKVK
jgi:hypothetical protein